MSDAPIEIAAGKTALKQLKAARKEQIAAATAADERAAPGGEGHQGSSLRGPS